MTNNLNAKIILLELTNRIERIYSRIKFWREVISENSDNEYHREHLNSEYAKFDELLLLYYKITGEDYKVTGKFLEDEE